MTLLDVNRHCGLEAGVSHWAFDSAAGRISARDSYGNLVMAIAAGPLFGPRVAAAFNTAGTTSYATALAAAPTSQGGIGRGAYSGSVAGRVAWTP